MNVSKYDRNNPEIITGFNMNIITGSQSHSLPKTNSVSNVCGLLWFEYFSTQAREKQAGVQHTVNMLETPLPNCTHGLVNKVSEFSSDQTNPSPCNGLELAGDSS